MSSYAQFLGDGANEATKAKVESQEISNVI